MDNFPKSKRELGLDYEPSAKVRDFWEGYVPEPQYSVNCVNHDCDKCKAAAQPAPVQEPASWMETVTANLVREGVNKHKARELAEHFYSLAQRPFVGLTDEERTEIRREHYARTLPLMDAVEAKLRSKNENHD